MFYFLNVFKKSLYPLQENACNAVLFCDTPEMLWGPAKHHLTPHLHRSELIMTELSFWGSSDKK